MKIAILGGSFDPPHLGHLLVAKQVTKYLNLDQVWLIPVFEHPFQKALAAADDRLAMTKLLEDGIIKVSDIEIKRQNVSYSIDTLEALQQQFPNDSFYWIIGSDQIPDFPKWKRWNDIITNFHLIIYAREATYDIIKKYIQQAWHLTEVTKNISILASEDLLTTNISSTVVRERVQQSTSIKAIVPKKVEEYIIEHNLYKKI